MTALEYFLNDELASTVWQDKYAADGENNPDDMHWRLATGFAEARYTKDKSKNLLEWKYYFYDLFKDFKQIMPQGRVMAGLGVEEGYRSLSNCLRLPPPTDSYNSIMKVDTMLVSAAKRGCGYGVGLSNLRPEGAITKNASRTSTGVTGFGNRYSNSTHEVGQEGRRGACLEDLDIRHPDSPYWAIVKMDKTKLTGANISFKIWDDYIQAVEKDEDYILRWPVDIELDLAFSIDDLPYNELKKVVRIDGTIAYVKKVKAKELWDAAIHSVWADGCPGLLFWERVTNYDPAHVYDKYKIDGTNACFHPDTLIDTVNGKMRIADIKEETSVYSMDENEKLCIRQASPAFVSRINAETLKITLNCGSSIQVTPDHKLYVHGKGWVEAKDLQLKDRIAHISRTNRGHKYVGIKLSTQDNRDYVMEHRLVYEGVHGKTEHDIHHKDNDSYHNYIDNLEELPHNEHSKLTATIHNPQNHQVKDERGKFVSTGTKVRRTNRRIDETITPNLINQYSNRIVSIEAGETIDVYDIIVEDTHCMVANNMVAHNCGEQPKAPFDTCRLLALNLFSIVDNPFTPEASINYDRLRELAYEQMLLGDDLVDLELIYVQKIIDKINKDEGPEDEKRYELELWTNVLDMAKSGRRVGCGITALADMLAAIGLKYDSDEALETVDKVMKVKMGAELDATIWMAQQYGPFEGWDNHKEFILVSDTGKFEDGNLKGTNDFYQMLVEEFPEQVVKMVVHGRRNVNWNTIAPVGTLSMLSRAIKYHNLTSGCEPIFSAPFHFRNKKVNAGESFDYEDEIGIRWKTFPVLMGAFKDWIETTYLYRKMLEVRGGEIRNLDTGETLKPEGILISSIDDLTKEMLQGFYENSPWFGSTANDIDWHRRIDMQAILQKYTTSAISSTINLPANVEESVISELYMYAHKKGLKGITAYRDGSKGNVLSATAHKKEGFTQHDAPKRPKELDAQFTATVANGRKYGVLVGTLEGKPYEVFAFQDPATNEKHIAGKIIKEKKNVYSFFSPRYDFENLQSLEVAEEVMLCRMVSMMLRHGAKVEYVVEQINKTPLTITSFGKAVARVLKSYISEDATTSEVCNNCGEQTIIYEEGCKKCKSCGNSRC